MLYKYFLFAGFAAVFTVTGSKDVQMSPPVVNVTTGAHPADGSLLPGIQYLSALTRVNIRQAMHLIEGG